MTSPSHRESRRLPRGIAASIVIGAGAGGLAWIVAGILPALSHSYTRLDQLTALALGAVVGATLLGARARRRRAAIEVAAGAGALLGGVGSLVGVSAMAFWHGTTGARLFVAERATAWALATAVAALLLDFWRANRSWKQAAEAFGLAAAGGAIAAVIFTLPGPTDAWQALAFVWFGATLGLAVAGPELWHARAVVESLPAPGLRPTVLSLHEWPIDDDQVVTIGEGQLAALAGGVAFYPPASGAVADGHHLRHPRYLADETRLTIGRARYLVRVLRGAG